jgi:hypothetical protein
MTDETQYYGEGICFDCKEHCSKVLLDEDDESSPLVSNCCGAGCGMLGDLYSEDQ